MTVTVTPPATAATELRRHRTTGYADGATTALAQLHATVSAGVLPVGPGGHALVPVDVATTCDRYTTPTGARSRAGVPHELLDRIPTADGELVALRVPGGGPAPGHAWSVGLAWIRLGLAERLLARSVTHLRGRTVAGTVTLHLPMVRAMLADAAAGIAEVRALLDPDHGPGVGGLGRVRDSLDEVGRTCLHLLGAAGFLADGPGAEARVAELLADTYPPPTDQPSTDPFSTELEAS
ncbi:hypothetical protein ACN28G_10455 [Micromonospora sp. WMMA1923]|uniref:hypothetical protein n=1 Tax=Micromonospora sp. WMMA1923 TaxID=3404125 RepID=UPI003B941E16